ncbi:unnamed protein product [Schistocephalus solidus]|uniref:Sugar phosphate exchanger 3 n=1 Tax=Schistocephalus solidus TaxID=70667 RepID=A0A183T4F8_SCHSO|nr:unnamed protein product [Schistocephalus solidus]
MKLPSGYQWIRLKLLHNNKERLWTFHSILYNCVLSRHQAFILVLTFVVYALFHASRKPLSVVKTVFHKPCLPIHPYLDTADWSRLVGSLEYGFLFFYAVAMFPWVDLRLFLSAGMALSGLSTVMFATGWPAVITILSKWFGKGRRGLVMGIWNANTNTGNVVGSLLAGLFVNWQWGASFIVPGVVLLLASYFVFIFLVDQPYAQLQLSSHLSSVNYANSCVSAFQNVLAYAFTLFFSKLVSYTFLYWLPNFLASVSAGKVSAEKAAVLSTIFDIGGIVGGVLAGFLKFHQSLGLLSNSVFSLSRCSLNYSTDHFLINFQGLLFLCGLLVTGPCALITTAVSADLGTQPSLQGNSKALATVTAIIDGTGSFG